MRESTHLTGCASLSVLLLTAPLASATAQATAGFDIDKSESVQSATAESVGRKTTAREHRVGTAEDTLGDDLTYVLVFGGFARKCPTSAGIVAGDFEYSISYDAVTAGDNGVVRHEHHVRRLVLGLEGEVDDRAQLKHVNFSGTFTIDRSGDGITAVSERREVPRQRFTPGPLGEPDIPAMTAAVEMTADVSVASAILMAGTTYRDAEAEWRKPNACVELAFDPPTDTVQLSAGQSKQVRADLKSKVDGAVVPWTTDNVNAINGAGTVLPRNVSDATSPSVTFTYTASAAPRRGNGIDVLAFSRGGIANAQWRIVDRYEGTFTQTRALNVGAADLPAGALADSARRYGLQSSQNYEMTGRLVWIPDSSRARKPQFSDAPATIYVPADGEVTIQVRGSGRSVAGECVLEGSKTFAIRELPPAAMQYLQLDIAPDGRYKLMLGMISYFLQFQLEVDCKAGRQRLRQTFNINDAAIVIGAQEGVVANDVVKGQTAAPIVIGPDRYTGTWEFASAAR